jgi:hypothetical protein
MIVIVVFSGTCSRIGSAGTVSVATSGTGGASSSTAGTTSAVPASGGVLSSVAVEVSVVVVPSPSSAYAVVVPKALSNRIAAIVKDRKNARMDVNMVFSF